MSTAPGTVTCAIDVGSTRVKASLWSGPDTLLTATALPYPRRHHPAGGAADRAAVISTFQAVVREMCTPANPDRPQPDVLILAAQMAGLAMVDHAGRPVGPVLSGIHTYAPTRIDELGPTSSGGADPAITSLAKYLWFAQENPRVTPQVAKVGGIKELLLHHLTGRWVTDRASASASGFYDLQARGWSHLALERAGLDPEQLPELREIDEPIGSITTETATSLGLRPGTPVLTGVGDGPAANLAVGAIGAGTMCVSRGTTLVARVLIDSEAAPIDLPLFTQHVQRDWRCVGVRLTHDSCTNTWNAPGRRSRRVPSEYLADYLLPLTDVYEVTEVAAIGGRPVQLPSSWNVTSIPDANVGRALALITTHGDIESIRGYYPAHTVSDRHPQPCSTRTGGRSQ